MKYTRIFWNNFLYENKISLVVGRFFFTVTAIDIIGQVSVEQSRETNPHRWPLSRDHTTEVSNICIFIRMRTVIEFY